MGLHFLQVPKPCHMRLRKGGRQFQRANLKTWYPPGYSFDLSSIRNWKQTFLKRLEVVVDLHTVIKGWRKMAVDTRSDDKLGQSWKKGFFPMTKGIFKFTSRWSFLLTIRVILKSSDETIFAVQDSNKIIVACFLKGWFFKRNSLYKIAILNKINKSKTFSNFELDIARTRILENLIWIPYSRWEQLYVNADTKYIEWMNNNWGWSTGKLQK